MLALSMRRAFFIICLLLFASLPALADTRTVTNCANSGNGSLRQALLNAVDGDEIVFNISLEAVGYSTGDTSPGLVTNEAPGAQWFRIVLASTLTIAAYMHIGYGQHDASPAKTLTIFVHGTEDGAGADLFIV